MITNNESVYAVYNADGSFAYFIENNSNTISKAYNSQTIVGGFNNTISGNYSNVLGGSNNKVVSSYASIVAGSNVTIPKSAYNRQSEITDTFDGAVVLGDGGVRKKQADEALALTLDFDNGIYIKNAGSEFSGPYAQGGVFGKITPGSEFKIGSYMAGFQHDNTLSATNYYPATQTSITLETNNWLKQAGYPKDRVSSVSYISLGANGIKLAGVNASVQNENFNQSGIYSTASIELNQDISLQTAKDGNNINLSADGDINLSPGGNINLNSQFGDAVANTATISLNANKIFLNAKNIPTNSNSIGESGQIAFDSNYLYYHNGIKWRRTALSEW